MKSLKQIAIFSSMMFLLIGVSSFSLKNGGDNTKFHSSNLNISIKGTSTLHDWEMKSAKGVCEVVFTIDKNDKISGLTNLAFTMDAKTIKSEHKMMDNNTYKALKTDKHKNINFTLTSGTVTPVDATTYRVKAIGNLTIAGSAKKVELDAVAKYNAADKSFTVNGSKNLKMTDFNVTPPTVMMGAIKTGNDITVAFSTKIIR